MKSILSLLILVSILFMTSCTREYTCQCVTKYSGKPPGLPDTSIVEHAIKNTKKDAATECEANSTKETNNGITYEVNCRLF